MKFIRPAAVAGTFYPAEPQHLKKMLDQYLNDATVPAKVPKAMIVPHAGYIYSGPIAASAYVGLRNIKDRIQRVVLIGPAHRVGFKGVAVSSADYFATPLGEIQIDTDCVKQLSQLPFVQYLDQAHELEHSLEVHLPFLQRCLSQFLLIPLVAGDAPAEDICSLIEILWGGKETLLVISSDLSHFHDYSSAQRKDAMTSRQIESLQYEQLDYDSACGRVPISGLLAYARNHALQVQTLDLRNSGDTAGDKDRVVGYGAYVINQ